MANGFPIFPLPRMVWSLLMIRAFPPLAAVSFKKFSTRLTFLFLMVVRSASDFSSIAAPCHPAWPGSLKEKAFRRRVEQKKTATRHHYVHTAYAPLLNHHRPPGSVKSCECFPIWRKSFEQSQNQKALLILSGTWNVRWGSEGCSLKLLQTLSSLKFKLFQLIFTVLLHVV